MCTTPRANNLFEGLSWKKISASDMSWMAPVACQQQGAFPVLLPELHNELLSCHRWEQASGELHLYPLEHCWDWEEDLVTIFASGSLETPWGGSWHQGASRLPEVSCCTGMGSFGQGASGILGGWDSSLTHYFSSRTGKPVRFLGNERKVPPGTWLYCHRHPMPINPTQPNSDQTGEWWLGNEMFCVLLA